MSNEKPVELTDTERAALMHHIGGWKFERQGLARAEDAFMAEVSRIVAAREAAARRDGEMRSAALWYAERGKVERVEALIDAAEKVSPLGAEHERTHPDERPVILIPARDIRAALAEPERDEEGGNV